MLAFYSRKPWISYLHNNTKEMGKICLETDKLIDNHRYTFIVGTIFNNSHNKELTYLSTRTRIISLHVSGILICTSD